MNSEIEKPENDSDNSQERNREDLALDEALQCWGAEKTAKPDHLAAQKLKTLNLPQDKSHDDSQLSPPSERSESACESSLPLCGNPSFSAKGWYWAIAATLLMAVAISWALRESSDIGPTQSQTAETPSQTINANALTLVSTNLDQQRIVLNRFREVFGDDLESVTEFNGQVKVSLRESSGESPKNTEGREYVSVRLVVISRDTKSLGNEWDIVHDVSALAEQEQRVKIPMSDEGLEFAVWTYPVDDELVSVDLKLQFNSPFKIGQATSLLQKIGESKLLFTATRNGMEYRAYQTINQLGSQDNIDQSTRFKRKSAAALTWAVL
jgi:hypothetical protein